MKDVFKWGILGPGTIANSFVQGLKVLDHAEVAAVGAYPAELESGKLFAQKYEIPTCYESYEALIDDKNIDIIYISALNPAHKKYSMMALESGKNVLCEKPLAINAKDAKDIVDCAKTNNRFLMEGMWTKFLPVTVSVREWISTGLIGEVRQFKSDFCFRCDWNPNNRLLSLELGGGALMDVGIYNIAYANMVYNSLPKKITHDAYIGPTGIDEQSCAILQYKNGELATILQAVRTPSPSPELGDAWIIGTEGHIYLPGFWHGKSATVRLNGKDPITYDFPFEASGYNCEAEEVMRCIREGRLQSDIHTHESSLSTLNIMDGIRQDWGIKFPFED